MLKRAVLLVLVACLAGLVVTGCKRGITEDQLVGKWTGKIVLPEDKGAAKTPDAIRNAIANLTISLELKKDSKGKAFTILASMIPIEGQWSLSGNTVTLSMSSAAGMDPSALAKSAQAQGQKVSESDVRKPMIGTLSEDGKTLTVKSSSQGSTSDQGAMVFTFQGKG